MMEIRNDIIAACQFLGLLSLLFWSLTWNLPKDFDTYQSTRKYSSKETEDNLKRTVGELTPIWNKHLIILDSFKTVKYSIDKKLSKDSPSDGSMLPPFNAWKEVELTRQGKVEQRDKIQENSKYLRRKLNYASSKCGAKILASNKEAKYQTAILNEKVDEYMLNPCKAKMWFIVELCDTIEATQIELANYELYSSAPKKFSTFWSNVYPTQTWHQLGTFEANDQRTMQSFDLSTRNMGKFVKVTISSHYGKEHYCPLSVFRILGYSMVYEYEEIEMQNEERENKKAGSNGIEIFHGKDGKKATNVTEIKLGTEGKNETNSITHEPNSRRLSFLLKACELEQKYCSDFDTSTSGEICLYQPFCIFLRRMFPIQGKESTCIKMCRRNELNTSKDTKQSLAGSFTSVTKVPTTLIQPNSRGTNDSESSANFSNLIFRSEVLPSIYDSDNNRIQINASGLISVSHESSREINDTGFGRRGNPIKRSEAPNSQANITKNDSKLSQPIKNIKENRITSDDGKQCDCRKEVRSFEESEWLLETNPSAMFPKESSRSDGAADSAALIQKESVLVKLNTRIKTSEANLNLINRYLQQLSELYKQQMEDMQSMFNGTVKALQVASEKAAAIDRQQHVSIELLEYKMKTLNKKIDYLIQGQEHILKRVLELHGFFLIIEFIIMSTIFSVFLNKLKKREYH